MPQGKRSLLMQECIAEPPHPCEASDKLIPQISPPGKKYLLLLFHIPMNRCSQPTTPLSTSPKKQNEASFGPEVIQPKQRDCAQLKHPAFCEGAQPNMFRPGCTDPWRLCPSESPRLRGPLSSYASTGKHSPYTPPSVLGPHRTSVY